MYTSPGKVVGVRASDRAYATLRAQILNGESASGSLLGEVEQAAALGMSRTPVREALARLAGDGLVVAAGRNLVVAQLSADQVRELFEVRQALEEQAVRLAAGRRRAADFAALALRFGDSPGLLGRGTAGQAEYYALIDEFDAAVDAAVGNAYLVRALTGVRTHLARIRRLSRERPERLRAAAGEHQLICEAIAVGDAGLAAHATHVHLHRSLTAILAVLSTAMPQPVRGDHVA